MISRHYFESYFEKRGQKYLLQKGQSRFGFSSPRAFQRWSRKWRSPSDSLVNGVFVCFYWGSIPAVTNRCTIVIFSSKKSILILRTTKSFLKLKNYELFLRNTSTLHTQDTNPKDFFNGCKSSSIWQNFGYATYWFLVLENQILFRD